MTESRMERASLMASLGAHLALAGMLIALAASGNSSHGSPDVIRVALVSSGNAIQAAGAAERKISSASTPSDNEAPALQSPMPESATEPQSDSALTSMAFTEGSASPSSETISTPASEIVTEAVSDTSAGALGAAQLESSPAAADDAGYAFARERIRAIIQSRVAYPALARKRGAEGTAVAGFSIGPEGRPSGLRLIRSSGHPVLDREVLRAVERASPYPAIARDVEVPVTFKIYSGGP